jgi:hypothetical protein
MAIIAPQVTTIIHSVRQRFGLTYEEYCVADAINFICSWKKNPTKTASGKYREAIAEFSDISPRTVDRAILSLVQKGIVTQPTRQSAEITSLWQEAISNTNSRQNGASEDFTTHAKMAQESRQNGVTFFSIYIHKKQEICANVPHLRNFQTSFLNDFLIFGFERASQFAQKLVNGAAVKIQDQEKQPKKLVNGAASKLEQAFDEFWAQYPRKKDKKQAFATYKKLSKKHADIMASLANYNAELATKGTQDEWVLYPSSFLNRLEEWLPTQPQTAQKLVNGAATNNDYQPQEDAVYKTAIAKVDWLNGLMIEGKIDKAWMEVSAFERLNSKGDRVFTDIEAYWIEELGGVREVVVGCSRAGFDARARLVWKQAKVRTA